MASSSETSQYGTAAGTAVGAGIGAFAGGVPGAALGAALGGAAGGTVGSLFGKKGQPWYDEGWFAERSAQINTFEQKLAASRAKYLTSLKGMYDRAFTRFTQNAEPGFANRGLSVDSGAFATALARQTADYESQLAPVESEWERQDLGTVEGMRGNLFGQKVAAKSGASNLAWGADREAGQSAGKFAASLGDYAFRAAMARNHTATTGTDKLGLSESYSTPRPNNPKFFDPYTS